MTEIPPDQRAFGSRLAAARSKAGLTQPGVAAWLTTHGVECGKQAVSAWETGRNMPNPLVFRRLCRLYSCSADSLLWDSDAEVPGSPLPPDLAARLAQLSEAQRVAVLRSLEAMLDALEAPGGPAALGAPIAAEHLATLQKLSDDAQARHGTQQQGHRATRR